jgi:TRAP-type C4-dicarboxylate transport system substrate-binding protein
MMRKSAYIIVGVAVVLFSLMPVYGAAPAKITLKFVDAYKPDHFGTLRYMQLFNEIGKRSNGRLEIIRAGGTEMIPMQDQLTICGKGGIDLLNVNPNYYSGIVPEGIVLGLPAVSWDFRNSVNLINTVIDDLDKLYRKKANVCIMPGSYTVTGIYILTKNKPVTGADDMKGLKIRTYGGYDEVLLNAFGAAAVRVDPAEIYTAAERGVIDGASRPAQSVIDWREYEVWKYLTKTPSSFMIAGLISVNVDTFNKLPADLQKIIVDTFKEETPNVLKYFEDKEKEAIAFVANKGIKMVDLKPGELAKWQSVPATASEQYFIKKCPESGKPLLDKLRAAAK